MIRKVLGKTGSVQRITGGTWIQGDAGITLALFQEARAELAVPGARVEPEAQAALEAMVERKHRRLRDMVVPHPPNLLGDFLGHNRQLAELWS